MSVTRLVFSVSTVTRSVFSVSIVTSFSVFYFDWSKVRNFCLVYSVPIIFPALFSFCYLSVCLRIRPIGSLRLQNC